MAHESVEAHTAVSGHIHQVDRRLDPATIEQLLQDYRDGIPTTMLTGKYKLGKGTVLRMLRRHGVEIRHQPLTVKQLKQAATLYGQGLSLAAVGERMGYDPSTIYSALKRAGIPRRESHGHSR